MKVDVLDSLEAFDRARSNWDSVYDSDPDAHILLSWTWNSLYLRKFRNDWLVLAARPDNASDYVAFFPIKVVTFPKDNGEFYDEIWVAGTPRADYTGFVCRPEYEDEALPALADQIKRMNWLRLKFEFVHVSEKRMRPFLKPFSAAKFSVEKIEHTINDINNNVCPFARLPADWETYLSESLSANTRQKVRRFLRKVDEGKEFRITYATPETLDRDLDTLMRFWEAKWGPRYGGKTADFTSATRKMMPGLFEAGMAVLPVIWHGEKAVGVLALLTDRKKRHLSYLLGSRDESFNSPPPGFILHAHSIRWAIQNGFTIYDFMLGNHPFKYMFANEEFRVLSIHVKHKNKQTAAEQIDRRSLTYILDRAKEAYDAGKLGDAERAYRQVLGVEPRHERSLFLLGQLTERQGKFIEARTLFKQVLALKPDNSAAWLWLGKTLQALGDMTGAAESYRKVLDLDPGNAEAPSLLAETSRPTDLLRTLTGKMPSWMPD